MDGTNDEAARSDDAAQRWREGYARARTRTYTGQDPDFAAYLQAPYDPLLSARMSGKVGGQVLRRLWQILARAARRSGHD